MIELWRRGRRFVGDFARFAGRGGVSAAILVAVGAILEGAGIVLLIPLLAVVTATRKAPGWIGSWGLAPLQAFFPHSTGDRLIALLTLFATLIAARTVVVCLRDVKLAALQMGFVEDLQVGVTRRLAGVRWDVVARLRQARVAHALGGDMQRCGQAAHFALQCATGVVMIVIQGGVAFALAPSLTAVSLAVLVVGALALAPALRRARNLGVASSAAYLSLVSDTAQFLGGLKQALSQNLQARFVTAFEAASADLRRQQVDFVGQQTLSRQALVALFALVAGAAVLVGFSLLHVGAPVLIALLVILIRMNGPAMQIQQGALQVAHSLPAYEAIKALEDELARAQEGPAAPAAGPPPVGAIVLRSVTFLHDAGGREADISEAGLREGSESHEAGPGGVVGLDLTITPHEFLGVRGASGAGKTTLADLIVGLFPPQSGEITVGGAPLRGPALASWREAIGYVCQDPLLFHDTIRGNLLWAQPEASEEALWRVLALAGARGFVEKMPGGLDSVVGDRGMLVSGGERQRLALARALLRAPPVLILDEATSAVDPAGERAILERLRALDPAPTLVMIAHRLDSLALCDRIIVLEGGRLAAPAEPAPPRSIAPPRRRVN